MPIEMRADKLTKNFDLSEFECNDGSWMPEHVYNNVKRAANSTHTLGLAIDIQIKGIDYKNLYNHINTLIFDGLLLEGGVGLYDNFIHYDIRGSRARWDNRKNI